jgi:hypothetical protein
MNRRARTCIVASALAGLLWPGAVLAQVVSRPAPPPIVTAEHTPWYLAGEPITFAGNIYYPAGAQVFFNAYEMVRSGFYEGVPLYVRTTLEPFSVVFVPISGGLMQPYERRRAGDIVGTAGSLTPSFPVVTPAEEDPYAFPGLVQAMAPPTRTATSLGSTSRELAPVLSRPAGGVGTGGTEATVPIAVAPSTPPGPMTTALRPKGLNGVFIDFNDRRWFNSGPAVEFSASRFTKIGDHHGFAVYSEAGKDNTIYVALTAQGGELVTPYALRR